MDFFRDFKDDMMLDDDSDIKKSQNEETATVE